MHSWSLFIISSELRSWYFSQTDESDSYFVCINIITVITKLISKSYNKSSLIIVILSISFSCWCIYMGLLCCFSVEVGCRVEPLGDTFTVDSLELIVAQFSWYSRLVLPHEFTSSMKTNFKWVRFLTETKNGSIHKNKSPQISKITTIHENCPTPQEFKWFHSNKSTIFNRIVGMWCHNN